MRMRQAAVGPRPVCCCGWIPGAEDAQGADPHQRTVCLAGRAGVLLGPSKAFLRRLAVLGATQRRRRCAPDVERRGTVPVQVRIEGRRRIVALRLDDRAGQHERQF